MKVILLFALLGLSFYQVCSYTSSLANTNDNPVGGGGSGGKRGRGVGGDTTSDTTCDVTPAENPKDEDCLKKTLLTSQRFWKDLLSLTVSKTVSNNELYVQEAKHLLKLMKCSDCDLHKILGGNGKIQLNLLDSLVPDEVKKITDTLLGVLGINKLDEKSMLKASMVIALADMKPATKDKLTNAMCENNEDQIKDLLVSLLAMIGCIHTMLERDDLVKSNVDDKNNLRALQKSGLLSTLQKSDLLSTLQESGLLSTLQESDPVSVLKGINSLLENLLGTDNEAKINYNKTLAASREINIKPTDLLKEILCVLEDILGVSINTEENQAKSGDGTDQSWKGTVEKAKEAADDLLCSGGGGVAR